MTVLELGGKRVELSNLDRVLWPEAGFTKRDLVDYYLGVADALLPHIRGRPLTLWRFPQGVHERGWWQNECRGAPAWLRTASIRGQRFCVVDDRASLAWVVNLGTIELHPFPSRVEALERPTAVIFDLDPGRPADVVACARVALRLRERLRALALTSFPKTSGSAGLHVYVPLNTPHSFEQTKAFARSLAAELAADLPELVVGTQRRAERRGRVLVDWLQNDATRSTVAPYSLRAMRWPTVSMPVTWEEVRKAVDEASADTLTVTALEAQMRIARLGDLFRPLVELEQSLPTRDV